MKHSNFKSNEEAKSYLRENGKYGSNGHLYLKQGIKCLLYDDITEDRVNSKTKIKTVFN